MMAKKSMLVSSVIVVMVAIAGMALLGQSCFLPESEVDVCPSGRRCPPGWTCATAQDICVMGLCGNGVVDPGEVCDDGNNRPGDGCSANCLSNETCGNGFVDVDMGEQCDDGNTISGDGCSADCLSDETCGNGYVDVGEECDDGNDDNDDACVQDCKHATCGDGYVWNGVEVCDDGGTVSGDGCSVDCLSDESCGNGYVDVDKGEQCDDGNDDNDDACVACKNATCGDGYVQAGVEECDDDGVNDISEWGNCPFCRWARCGDGFVWDGVEQCDPKTNPPPDYCSPDCRSDGSCGNGYVDIERGEECDDGNHNGNDSCPSGFDDIPVPSQEQLAAELCRVAYCGDHFVRSGAEVCDDGNHQVGDGCSPDCLSEEFCGNGYVDVINGEECDDGNNVDDDICPSGMGGCLNPYCGDGFVAPWEDCDTNGRSCANSGEFCYPDCTCS